MALLLTVFAGITIIKTGNSRITRRSKLPFWSSRTADREFVTTCAGLKTACLELGTACLEFPTVRLELKTARVQFGTADLQLTTAHW